MVLVPYVSMSAALIDAPAIDEISNVKPGL